VRATKPAKSSTRICWFFSYRQKVDSLGNDHNIYSMAGVSTHRDAGAGGVFDRDVENIIETD
jgi:hypothetical protein